MTGPFTLRNQAESSLLRLPGELRNRIFELVVGGNIVVVSTWTQQPAKPFVYLTSADSSGSDAKGTQASSRAPALGIFTIGLVCRQLHQETALTQYIKNIFHFDDMEAGRAFVDGLTSTQRALLTSISLNVEGYFGIDFSWDFISSMWRYVADNDTDMFLPELERVYISVDDQKGSLQAKEKEVLHAIGRKLKIRIAREECVSLMNLDVFQGMENRSQAKTTKLSWNGGAPV
ncbi:hypothetical protein BKA58DRAFT_462254 [Alternaria rosae]|uniref:uncharacterized protein n=1 Tax=Alternaria rosae TaxID=1187941 RepID=UPI001E8CDBDB|nr:uncharacterized protein BKA58DRAFT_462254 [Alternaria rosae]KAH6864804.1 hypothetical protein BKA58DRAFT_462254 [Alternaria rosae]